MSGGWQSENSARGHPARGMLHPAIGHPARRVRHSARGHPARGVRHPAVRCGGVVVPSECVLDQSLQALGLGFK